ncbi:hypothetical protein PAXRUDRAFT_16771 [Paxillus rubicundulus Ve08.2h10]|uniref:Unplaced genomic scaffold scaffold_1707, whole genome shotgun sequence n=1 Tax=Paxillus rubicundulus Ve08.2h10 TaxID=930991 RepID=A0A0D0CTA3_9AGAM|nr:hypothetical protein PAXRUDRAFT_16771 [Paxillus rubicundulus Ve08.2h10]
MSDVQIHENVLILTVNNLLTSWLTYIIDFTPKQLGPMKLLLHLNDTCKYVDDSDSKDSSKTPDPAVHTKRKNITLTLDISLALEQDEAYRIIPKHTNTIPVDLHSIHKGQKIAKCDIFDHDSVDDTLWPPIHPRAFHEVGMNIPMTSLHMIKTIPAPVKAASAGKENSHI